MATIIAKGPIGQTIDELDGVTNGADVIVGTSGMDHIEGLGGDDIIKGGGGADFIYGAASIEPNGKLCRKAQLSAFCGPPAA
jgi:Ca2+-binding RTX toxin-like protein